MTDSKGNGVESHIIREVKRHQLTGDEYQRLTPWGYCEILDRQIGELTSVVNELIRFVNAYRSMYRISKE